MDKNLVATQSIEINSTPNDVWKTLTNPEKIKIYLFGTETITDWKMGSPILFQGEYNGHPYKDKGNVIEHVENSILSYNYWSGFSGLEDKSENYSLVTYTIENISASKVKFTWTQKGFASKDGQVHTEQGLKTMLEQIKKLAEE
ncbi:MAG: ATPase [Bacteroidetes bacterium]|nr:MAG: ATPase [Bacteroidota bacterium]